MADEDLRRWAIEQVMSHRSGNGFTLKTVMDEAREVIAFVKGNKPELEPQKA